LVCTAQVLLNALRHGFLSMALLRLLIVDECHHAHGRHPYRQIMNEFYHTADAAARPAVFGMTASPINKQGKAAGLSLLASEHRLGADIHHGIQLRPQKSAY
jgi:endoribonuclease Dicer